MRSSLRWKVSSHSAETLTSTMWVVRFVSSRRIRSGCRLPNLCSLATLKFLGAMFFSKSRTSLCLRMIFRLCVLSLFSTWFSVSRPAWHLLQIWSCCCCHVKFALTGMMLSRALWACLQSHSFVWKLSVFGCKWCCRERFPEAPLVRQFL